MELDEAIVVSPAAAEIVVEVDQALDRLAKHDQRMSEIVQLLYFGGMTYDETADALGMSPGFVSRHLTLLREAGFVEARRDGNHAIYSLTDVGRGFCSAVARLLG